MHTIRQAQIEALSIDLFSRFDRRALAHVKTYFPTDCEGLDDDAVMYHVRRGLNRARNYGFVSERDLLRFLNVMFTFGTEFDSMAEYAWTRPFLEGRDLSPASRMDALMEEIEAMVDPAQGPGDDDAPEYGPAGQDPDEFDGIVWEVDANPNYVPVSIVPEIEPYERGPAPGTVPVVPWMDEDDWQDGDEDSEVTKGEGMVQENHG